MSITVHRALLTAASATALACAPASSAVAQVDSNIVLNLMVECSKIGDVTTRVACYDNNIRIARATTETPAPRQGGTLQGSSAPATPATPTAPAVAAAPATPTMPASTARVSPAPARRPTAPAADLTRGTPTVASVASIRPGAYVLTLEDGAKWEFIEDMPASYRAPSRGSKVEIERGTFGSYRMRFDGQQPVRVQRVR